MSSIPLVLRLFEEGVPTRLEFIEKGWRVYYHTSNLEDRQVLNLLTNYCEVYHCFKRGDISIKEREPYKNLFDKNGVVNCQLPSAIDAFTIITMYEERKIERDAKLAALKIERQAMFDTEFAHANKVYEQVEALLKGLDKRLAENNLVLEHRDGDGDCVESNDDIILAVRDTKSKAQKDFGWTFIDKPERLSV